MKRGDEMSTSRKDFVKFLSPGSFYNETTTKEIKSWDIKEAIKMASKISERLGAKHYGFRFSTSIISKDVPDGEGGFLEVLPKQVATSGTYFLGGYLETLDQVEKRADPKEDILLSNMHCNGWFVVCVNSNSYRSTTPFDENSTLLDKEGNIVEKGDSKKWKDYRKATQIRVAKYYAEMVVTPLARQKAFETFRSKNET
jgi:hypothetical protein